MSLPQNDDDFETRHVKLQNARTKYQLEQKSFGLTEDQRNQLNLVNVPPVLRSLPTKERRSWISGMQFMIMYKIYDAYQYFCQNGNWTIPEMVALYQSNWLLKEPKIILEFGVDLKLFNNKLLKLEFSSFWSSFLSVEIEINSGVIYTWTN